MSRSNRTGAFELSEEPTLAELFKVYGRRMKLSIRTNTVATVVAYNPADQTATIRLDILEIIKVLQSLIPGVDPNLTDEEEAKPPVIVTSVPVAWPKAGGGYLTFPLIAGDTGEVTIQDRGLQQWLNRTASLPVDPVQMATHALSDAVFHPGLSPRIDPITPPTDLTAAVLHHATGIKLGRAAVLANARVSDTTVSGATMATLISSLITGYNAMAVQFNAVIGTPILATGPLSIIPLIPPVDFGVIATGSPKVKSE